MTKKDRPTDLKAARQRVQNHIAERALSRGRKLTPREKLENLESEFGFEKGYFAKMRKIIDE
jgi:hypothetical protein